MSFAWLGASEFGSDGDNFVKCKKALTVLFTCCSRFSKSMCVSPYTLNWAKSDTHCPNLVEPETANLAKPKGVPVKIRWGVDFARTWPSLAHMWSVWYREYVDDADLPRIMVRFEDLLFHTEVVIDAIRQCVGATWVDEEQFHYSAAPAKTHPYFSKFKAPSSLISAMIKYGQDDDSGSARTGSMTEADLKYAENSLDTDLMDLFHYQRRP